MYHHSLRIFFNEDRGAFEYQVHRVHETVFVGYAPYYEDAVADARREAYRLDLQLEGECNAQSSLR